VTGLVSREHDDDGRNKIQEGSIFASSKVTTTNSGTNKTVRLQKIQHPIDRNEVYAFH
jgi:hypothetical protein